MPSIDLSMNYSIVFSRKEKKSPATFADLCHCFNRCTLVYTIVLAVVNFVLSGAVGEKTRTLC